ncbi:MAG TPA: hypothetical protein VKY74_26735 [Chloroflexia bacterium]|nr:hypothetical protein [Chloroflexia bacterium]
MADPRIEVQFRNATTGAVFAQATVPASQLPASFAPATTMFLGEAEYTVVQAHPPTATEFGQTGRLVLHLAPVTRVDPRQILYSLPTLCDPIPGLQPGTSKRGQPVVELHEDEWRQIECVSRQHAPAIAQECAAIRRIFQEASTAAGAVRAFRVLHLRQAIPVPIPAGLPIGAIVQTWPAAVPYAGVAYLQAEELIADGFAFRVGPLVFYGQVGAAGIVILGLAPASASAPAAPDLAVQLGAFLTRYDLLLVDWCAIQVLAGAEPALPPYLARRFPESRPSPKG